MIRRNLDLFLLTLLTILIILDSLFQLSLGPVTELLGTVFILFAPGYLLALMIFPETAVEFPVRVAVSIGLSLAMAAIGGILLYAIGAGLGDSSWIALIGSFNILGSAIVLINRSSPGPVEVEYTVVELSRMQGGLIVLILVAVIGIVLMARQSAYEQPSAGFTELWIASADQQRDHVQIGVHNHENQTASYRVVMRINGRFVEDWTNIELASNQQWVTEYHLPPRLSRNETIVVTLHLTSAPTSTYRRVQFQRAPIGN